MAQKAIITDMRAKAKRQHRATAAYDAMLRWINAEILGGGK